MFVGENGVIFNVGRSRKIKQKKNKDMTAVGNLMGEVSRISSYYT